MSKTDKNKPTYVVGYKYINKQGLEAEVIAYKGRKNIDVMFSDGSIVKGTTGSYIAKGLPMHPTYGKILVGDRFSCRDGDTVEVVEYINTNKILCRWLSDGAEKYTNSKTLRHGVNKHPNSGKIFVGDLFKTNVGVVEVVEYRDAKDITVKLEDGRTTNITAQRLKDGRVNSRLLVAEDRIGHKFKTNSGWSGEVVEYKNSSNVTILWQDGSKFVASWGDIIKGGIKPLCQPSVAGVGYFGVGRFIPRSYSLINGKEYYDETVYQYWQRMINRVYSEHELNRPSGESYKEASVCDEWHNFQNFAEWALLQSNVGSKDSKGNIYHLDKDIVKFGNKVYSPDYCVFVPNVINAFFSDKEVGSSGFSGVGVIKPRAENHKVGYVSEVDHLGNWKYLGFFDTPEEAFVEYKKAKEAVAKELISQWDGVVDSRVIESLRNFRVNPEGFVW